MTTATRKPKRTRAKRKQAKAKGKEKRAQSDARANWGANEMPRHCRNVACGSENSTVVNTRRFTAPPRTIRYRRCADCGQRFSTVEIEKSATV